MQDGAVTVESSNATYTMGVAAAAADTQTVGVFLEEVGYFLEDMKKDLWWLLRAAHQPSGEVFYRGDEELVQVAPEKEALISGLSQRFKVHVEAHENQVRSKIAIIPTVTPEEMDILTTLRKLKFHCRGKVEVFPCMKEANNAAIWGAYHNFVSGSEPQWIVASDGAGQKLVFGQFASVVPIFVSPDKKEIKILHVFCPDRKKRHWAFPGGDIIRGVDNNLYDAARREFQDELGCFFDRGWMDCFEADLPADATLEITCGRNVQFVGLEKDGVRYPCRSYFFCQVKEEFYNSSKMYEDAQGVIKLPTSSGKFVHWDDLDNASKVHVDGFTFAEHDEARWLNLDFDTGRLWSEDTRVVRKENVELFKQQPDKIWQFFAKLLGCEMPEKAQFQLPSDFNHDGPFAVRMTGIDKTATDLDIAEFFEAGEVIKTSLIKQFEIPKHTARIEFTDVKMLEAALTLSGRILLRRKVKVELWSDATDAGNGTGDAAPGARPLEAYDGPLPEEPPFKCMVRNLDRTVDRDLLGYFFYDRACLVHDVEFPVKGERHAGCVEFQDQESLRKALSLNNAIFAGRETTIELPGATPAGGSQGGGRRDDDRRERRDKGGGKGGKGKSREFDREGRPLREERGPPSREEFGSERPRLQLKARTAPADPDGYGNVREQQAQDPERRNPAPRADPFGGARPRDERFAKTRADEDSNWRR